MFNIYKKSSERKRKTEATNLYFNIVFNVVQ